MSVPAPAPAPVVSTPSTVQVKAPVLKDCKLFVDAKAADGGDDSKDIAERLKELGARVRDQLVEGKHFSYFPAGDGTSRAAMYTYRV